MLERPPAGSIPDAPGSYQFKDVDGRVIYVGKAKSLRSRLSNYFAAPDTLLPRTRQMVQSAATVEWIVARNEVEAFFLEFNLIKRYKPRFNIRLKDDKSYPYLAVTLDEPWPQATVRRGAKRKGQRWFGPFAHAYAIRETLDLLLRTFPIRTCSNGKFLRHERLGRPCLYAHIEKCVAPCVGAISPEEYDELVRELIAFLDGDHDPVVQRLAEGMRQAADALEFERAARLRDQLTSVRKVIERQQMVGDPNEDFDCIGIHDDALEAAVQVFHVRRGRMVGRKGVVVDKVEDLTRPELVGRLLELIYGDEPDVPREVLVPVIPDEPELHSAILTARRADTTGRANSASVAIRVPLRGEKRGFLEMVTKNAEEEFRRHRLRRAADHNARARALTDLQDALELPVAPLRIECYDISHIQGFEIVASMVVMEDGLPKRSDYRRFKIKTLDGQDDFAAMEEVLTRRFTRLLEDRELPVGQRSGRFSYPPNLVLIDGGKGQLGRAVEVLENLGLSEEIAVASLAKRLEEVFVPGSPDPARIPRDSQALFLLQQVRDEAHRFAITFHRERRGKAMTRSVLDGIPGLGATRRTRLLKEIGSVKKLRQTSLDDLRALSWLPDPVAEAVHERLHGPAAPVPRRTSVPVIPLPAGSIATAVLEADPAVDDPAPTDGCPSPEHEVP